MKTSAAASTPVYFSMTSAAATAVTSSRYPLTAQVFSPYFTKYRVGSTVSIAFLEVLADVCRTAGARSRPRGCRAC